MDLATAQQRIQADVERMRALYLQPVFDEWAILGLGRPTSGVLAYQGPRAERFRENFASDVEPLRAVAAGKNLVPGDFEFALEATGTRYDALMMLGAASYLVCNHTSRTMAEIRSDGKWLKAQGVFVELSEKFRADPLEV